MILPLLLTLSLMGGTVVQSYDFDNSDAINGTHQFSTVGFDTSLGTLVDVKLVLTAVRMSSDVWVNNPTANFYPAQQVPSSVGFIPWIDSADGEHWSMLSFSSIIFPHGDHFWYVIPPFSTSQLERSTDTDRLYGNGGVHIDWGPYEFDLSTVNDPPLSYWHDDHDLTFDPTTFLYVDLLTGPWPGTYGLNSLTYGMTYEIHYVYQ